MFLSALANMPVLENENFYKPLLIGGIGGETVQVTYLSSDGSEEEVSLKSRGYYCSTSVFNEETFTYEQGVDGSFVEGEQFIVSGEDIWNQGRIIVLVNAASISAADHFTCLLDKCPNATIMGFTSTNSSGQAVNGINISEKEQFSYSAVPTIDADGGVFVDAGADRLRKVGIDQIIDFDEQAVKALFDEDKDYILERALLR